ncbi:MAG: tripartite tricarboxylate transporter substrate binding protein [Acetobacteraceae bacterium]|nr:tripartite tricarboxylate transporter substrate binding protein [Acetobacteraceae bacterium]MCX7683818.1 tripartite tricarboxylate transporter substrate binding protein [Acetobacteraceae bacterium]MDW8397794.1 tripartite tricarboxylate transporter substrate binding protein [Acetobacteraceae bacterium]
MRAPFLPRRALFALAAAPALPAAAQTRPDGPVTIIVPFTPGTVQDILARLLAPFLQSALGQPVVVDNRSGASGVIGTGAVARAAPDGRTLLIQGVPFVMAPPLMRALPYDPATGFTPITRICEGHVLLCVHPSLPVRSVEEFVALARARGGELDYGSPGNGTAHHMIMELFRLRAGIRLTHIPYRGTAPAVQDLLGGRIPAMMVPVPVALPHVQGGRLRALAIGSERRSPELPTVPTFAEAGYPLEGATLWYGLFGPPAMPPPLVAALHALVREWLADPRTAETLRAQMLEPLAEPPDAFAAFIARQLPHWAQVVREAGIEAG